MFSIIKHIFTLSSLTLIFSACSTMNKNECLNADWRTIGYSDGARGYKASRIGQHQSACAEYAVRPDLNAYNSGREQGLSQFCTARTGYNRGLRGYGYNGVCARHNEGAFLEAYNYGVTIYKATQRLQTLKNKYADEDAYIRKLEKRLRKKEDILVSGKLTKVKALTLLQETKEMAEELGKSKSRLYRLDKKIHKQVQRISYLKENSGY